jgi:hypothetical protein
MSALFSESLCTPQQARVAVTMRMVVMRLADRRGVHDQDKK